MHILLAILKVIGIIVLILIGLLVLILALVLFVPIRYMADVSYEEKANGKAQLTWLAHLVCVRAWISDNEVNYVLRIGGKKLNPGQSKADPQKASKKQKPKPKQNKKQKTAKKSKKTETELIEINPEDVTLVKLKKPESEEPAPVKPEKAAVTAPKESKAAPVKTVVKQAQEKKKRRSFRDRVSAAGEKFKNIKYTLKSIYDKIDKTKENLSQMWSKLHEEENQASIQLVKNELLKVWKQIKPRRIRGAISFGTDDPAMTGQILGVCAILYPVYQDNLKITPDFENECLEGSLYVKGRIRIFPLLMSGFKIYRDKNIMRLYRNLRS